MKKLFLSALMLVLLTGFAFGQSPTLDQHNHNIWADSFHVLGAAVDTSSIISVANFAAFSIWAEHDSIGGCDSSSVHIIWDISPVNDTSARFWYQALDTLICSTAVASLPYITFEDISGTIGDTRYARFRTVCTNTSDDSSRVVIKLFRRE